MRLGDVLRFAVGTADPTTGAPGEVYYNSTTGKLRLCTSSSPVTWVDVPKELSNMKSRRLSVTIPAATTAEVELIFTQGSFADTAYTAVAAVEHNNANNMTLRVRKLLRRTVNSVVVQVSNDDAVNAHTGTVHVIAMHD